MPIHNYRVREREGEGEREIQTDRQTDRDEQRQIKLRAKVQSNANWPSRPMQWPLVLPVKMKWNNININQSVRWLPCGDTHYINWTAHYPMRWLCCKFDAFLNTRTTRWDLGNGLCQSKLTSQWHSCVMNWSNATSQWDSYFVKLDVITHSVTFRP